MLCRFQALCFISVYPGELVEESVSFIRHWSRWRSRPRHHSQMCRGKEYKHTNHSNKINPFNANPVLWVFCSKWMLMFAPGRSQHDSVRQRCDRQRRPSFCHLSPAHRGGRSNPETFTGPLRCPPCDTLPGCSSNTTQQPVEQNQNGHFWVWGQGSRSEHGADGQIQITLMWVKLNCASYKTFWTSFCPATISSLNSLNRVSSQHGDNHFETSWSDAYFTSVNIPEYCLTQS